MIEANFEQIRQEAVNAGFITHEEIDQVLALLDDPNFTIGAAVMFTAWGSPLRTLACHMTAGGE